MRYFRREYCRGLVMGDGLGKRLQTVLPLTIVKPPSTDRDHRQRIPRL